MLDAKQIIDRAMSYLGVPHHHQGRNRQFGLDCIGLAIVVMQDLGVKINDCVTYSNPPDQGFFLSLVKSHVKEKSSKLISPSDLILIAPKRLVHHAAIVISEGEIIHSDSKCGVEITSLASWRSRIRYAFDLRSIDGQ